MINISYPLMFTPYFKEVIWGGTNLLKLKNVSSEARWKDCDMKIGETWEISGLHSHTSKIANGPLRGLSLNDAVSLMGVDLLGTKGMRHNYGEFPLLVKFIDSNDQLSIQVHPNDKLASELHGPMAKGKTEMWYIIDAEPGAYIYCGLKHKIDEANYREAIANSTIEQLLVKHEVKSGDVFFIPAGRIHSIGAGCLLAEIQQSSDYTYRIYDFNRKDKDGKPRDLHTDYAARAIVYDDVVASGRCFDDSLKACDDVTKPLVRSDFFNTDLISLSNETYNLKFQHLETFKIFQCVQGQGTMLDDSGYRIVLSKGTTLLLPASVEKVTLTANTDSFKVINAYLP